MDVSLGSQCQCLQHVVAMNVEAKSAMLVGEIGHRAVVTPDVDQLLGYASALTGTDYADGCQRTSLLQSPACCFIFAACLISTCHICQRLLHTLTALKTPRRIALTSPNHLLDGQRSVVAAGLSLESSCLSSELFLQEFWGS